jgi:hypothetical protein
MVWFKSLFSDLSVRPGVKNRSKLNLTNDLGVLWVWGIEDDTNLVSPMSVLNMNLY